MPVYDPSLPSSFFYRYAFADQSKITKEGGGAIAHGDVVGEIANGGTSAAKWIKNGSVAAPTWRTDGPGGRTGLRFSGSQALRLDTAAGLSSLDGLTVIVVGCVDDTSRLDLFSITNAGGGARALLYSGGDGNLRAGGRRLDTDSFQDVEIAPVTPGVPFILTATFDYEHGRFRGYKDGVLRVDTPFQAPGKSGSGAASAVLAADFNVPSQRLKGWLFEMDAVRSAPTADDLVPLHHYLRITTGIG